jgi:DNA polymerase alpha subunit B
MKRRNDFGTPSAKASKLNNTSSPAGDKTPTLGATAEPSQLGYDTLRLHHPVQN